MITIDGVNLTIQDCLKGNQFSIALIPYTLKKTLFKGYRRGQSCHVEFDLLGKYVIQHLIKDKS